MYDLLLTLVKVFEAAQYLRDYQLGLLLRYLPILLQVEVEIGPGAKLKYRAKAVVIDLDGVILMHDPTMVQILVYLVLSDRVLYVIIFDLLGPTVIKVVYLACDFSAAFQVECFVHF